MQVEKKTAVYILIGLVALTGMVLIQEVRLGFDSSSGLESYWEVRLGFDSSSGLESYWEVRLGFDSSSGLMLDREEGFVKINRSDTKIEGYYVQELKTDEGVYSGAILLNSSSVLKRRYPDIEPNTSLHFSALNVRSSDFARRTGSCRSFTLAVEQNGDRIGSFNITPEGRSDFVVATESYPAETWITLRVLPNQCSWRYPAIAVDSFYLKEQGSVVFRPVESLYIHAELD